MSVSAPKLKVNWYITTAVLGSLKLSSHSTKSATNEISMQVHTRLDKNARVGRIIQTGSQYCKKHGGSGWFSKQNVICWISFFSFEMYSWRVGMNTTRFRYQTMMHILCEIRNAKGIPYLYMEKIYCFNFRALHFRISLGEKKIQKLSFSLLMT